MDNVGSMAVDWVGKKIYWSNPKQQLVSLVMMNAIFLNIRTRNSKMYPRVGLIAF